MQKKKMDSRLNGKISKKGFVRATKKDYEYVKKEFKKKLDKSRKIIPFVNEVIALYKYITDKKVHWDRKVFAVGALLYFILPIDAIPDIIPIIGYLDDAGVIAIAIAYYGKEIKPYLGK